MSEGSIGSGGSDGGSAEGGPSGGETTDEQISQQEVRRRKLAAIRSAGIDPYPASFAPTASAASIRAAHGSLEAGSETSDEVTVAGRLMLIRRQGSLSFATVRDRNGEIQLFVDPKTLGTPEHERFDQLDRGDWVGVSGTVMTTRRGELSIRVTSFELLSKALRPLPDKHKGLADVDTRFRQRYVDLVVNERTREIFRVRRDVIRGLRRHLEQQGFWEIEGPMLSTIQGGAIARPFTTHHNTLDVDLYLRIALELHLKRLIVGGMERVFELGRVFRNEGVDTTHNPEFTMLEAYQAYTDYHGMMDLTQALVQAATAEAQDGSLSVTLAGEALDLSGEWPRVTMADLIASEAGVQMDPAMDVAQARAILDDMGLPYEQRWGAGRLMFEVFDERVQRSVRGPLFCLDYPQEVSPLSRAHRTRPGYVERFELLIDGHAICNAYSEQNDPAQQLATFEAGAKAKREGDPEAGDVDLDYIRALEYGMPPTGGLGIGVDRLVMLIAGAESIREVILFPTLRPESPEN